MLCSPLNRKCYPQRNVNWQCGDHWEESSTAKVSTAVKLTASSESYAQLSRAGLDSVFGGSFTIEIVYKLIALVHSHRSGIFTNYGAYSCSCPEDDTSCTPHCLGILQQSSAEGGNNV